MWIWTGRSGGDDGCIRGSCTNRCSLEISIIRVHLFTTRMRRCVDGGRQSGAVLSLLVNWTVTFDQKYSLGDL